MIKKGIIAGTIFGILDILPMLMMEFTDKAAAITGAFISRFAIGLLIYTTNLGVNKILTGLIIGLLLSIPDALITKNYAPIIGSGIVGGLIIGFIASRQKL
jgi:hypothetical protein